LDWKRFFDNLGMNGTHWQWRMMRWERNFKGMLKGQATPGTAEISLTKIIIFVNLLLFSLMVIHGTSSGLGGRVLLSPPTQLLIGWGGQYWPLVLKYDQWWRCLTYAFTHGGIIHIGFNMMVLYQVGPLVETEIGKARFILLYTLTALTATALGYLWHPMTPVVGASGSLFGLIGFAITYYHRMGPPGHHIRNFMAKWAIYAFVFGLMVGADNAGHLGGGLGGAALGLVLPMGYRVRGLAPKVFNLLAALCLAATLGSLIMLAINIFKNF
jgi:rhomboid protease GluP